MKEKDPLLAASRQSEATGDNCSGNRSQDHKTSIMLIAEEFSEVEFTDRRYSWVVLFMLVFSNIITRGYLRSFGLLTNKIAVIYPDASSKLIGAMVGLLTGFAVIFAPVSGGLINTCGIRSSILLGTFFTFAGLIISSMLDQATLLPFTLSAVTGAGLCFIESVQVVVIADYFKSKLSFANGIRVCGKSLGGMLAPLLITFLLENYSLEQAYLLIGATMLHTLLVAVVIQPFQIHKRLRLMKLISSFCKINEVNLNRKRLLMFLERRFQSSGEEPRKKFLEFGILKKPSYIFYFVTSIGAACAIPLVTIYIPIYGDSIGLSAWQNSLILFIMSFVDLVLRFLIGWVINRNIMRKNTCIAFCMLIGGVSTAMMPLTNDMLSLTWASCLFAFAYSSFFEFINVILCDVFGKETVSTTWGFVHFAMGLTNTLVSFLIGYLANYSGNYVSSFLLMGCGTIVSSLLLFWDSISERRHRYYSL